MNAAAQVANASSFFGSRAPAPRQPRPQQPQQHRALNPFQFKGLLGGGGGGEAAGGEVAGAGLAADVAELAPLALL